MTALQMEQQFPRRTKDLFFADQAAGRLHTIHNGMPAGKQVHRVQDRQQQRLAADRKLVQHALVNATEHFDGHDPDRPLQRGFGRPDPAWTTRLAVVEPPIIILDRDMEPSAQDEPHHGVPDSLRPGPRATAV